MPTNKRWGTDTTALTTLPTGAIIPVITAEGADSHILSDNLGVVTAGTPKVITVTGTAGGLVDHPVTHSLGTPNVTADLFILVDGITEYRPVQFIPGAGNDANSGVVRIDSSVLPPATHPNGALLDGETATLRISAGSITVGNSFTSIDIRDYGAVAGDGQDNETAINSAIAALKADGGGELVIPTGRWRKTGRMTFDFPAVVRGLSWNSELVQDSNDIAILFQPAVNGERIAGPAVKELAIDMNQGGQLDAGAIIFNASEQWLADHVYVHDCGTPGQDNPLGVNGISNSSGSLTGHPSRGTARACLVERATKAAFDFTFGSLGGLVEGCVAREMQGNGATPGFQVNGGNGTRVIANTAEKTEGAGFIFAVNGQGIAAEDFMVAHNLSVDAGEYGSSSDANGFLVGNSGFVSTATKARATFFDNRAEGATQSGFKFQNLSAITAIANWAIGNGVHGFVGDGTTTPSVDWMKFVDNHADANAQAGYLFRGVNRLRLRGNIAENGHTYGAWFFGAVTDAALVDNDLEGSIKSVGYTVTPTLIRGALNRLTGTSDLTDTIAF